MLRRLAPRFDGIPGRWPLAGLAVAVLAIVVVGLYFLASRPGLVSADEIVRKAQETAASPAAAGVRSFVSVETAVSRPGNPRMNAYSGLSGDEEIRSDTKRWYEAPDVWRIENNVTMVDAQGKRLPNYDKHWVIVADGKEVWRYDARGNTVAVNEIDASSSGKSDSYDAGSPLGQGTLDLQKVLQLSNPNVRPKLLGEETVAGRKAYVLAFATGTPSASAPEMSGPRTVWVDKETFFVLKVVQVSGTDGKWLSTTEVTSIQYNTVIDPALFTFTPPADAQVDDQRPKPVPTKGEFEQQVEAIASQTDFPVFLPRQVPNGLVPQQPRVDDALGLQVEYVPSDPADRDKFPSMRVIQQRATADLVSRWTEGAESTSIGGNQAWLRRGVRDVDGTGTDSAALVLRNGTLVSISSFTIMAEDLAQIASSLEPVRGGHPPLPNPSVPSRAPLPTAASIPAPKFTILRPTWLPEQMEVREQLKLDPTSTGSMVEIGFDPRPDEHRPHLVLVLTEMARAAAPSPAGKPDPEETHETIGGRDVRVISRGENWITLTWVQGDVVLTLTNPYDPPGHPRYTPDQLREIVESIR